MNDDDDDDAHDFEILKQLILSELFSVLLKMVVKLIETWISLNVDGCYLCLFQDGWNESKVNKINQNVKYNNQEYKNKKKSNPSESFFRCRSGLRLLRRSGLCSLCNLSLIVRVIGWPVGRVWIYEAETNTDMQSVSLADPFKNMIWL